jgi:hypothetical protein
LPDLQNLHSRHSGVLQLSVDCHAEVGAENILESDDVVAHIDGGHTLADGLDNTGTLVTEDNWESTLGILAGESVGICGMSIIVTLIGSEFVSAFVLFSVQKAGLMAGLTGMANASVVDFNAHLTSLGGSDLDVLNGQRRAGLPGNSSLSIVQHS